jgi:ribosomal protein L40E
LANTKSLSDPLFGDFGYSRDAEIIKNSLKNGKKKKHELILTTIQIEKKEGGWLGRIMAGKGGLFNKSKMEFTYPSLDQLFARLAHAAKVGYGVIPRGAPFSDSRYPRQSAEFQQPYQPQFPQPYQPPSPYVPPAPYIAPPQHVPSTPPASPPITNSKQCPQCKAYSPEQAKYCLNCGAKFEETPPPAPSSKKFCPNCGAQIVGSGKFCVSCGTKL